MPSNNIRLSDIGAGRSKVAAKGIPDELDKMERSYLERERAKTKTIIEGNNDKRAMRVLKMRYARAVYIYLVWYSIICAAIVTVDGFRFFHFFLPEKVLLTLIGSTGVSAIGLVGFVVNGLFKPIKPPAEQSQEARE